MVPNLISKESVASLKSKVALSTVPLSISIPEVPDVTPAPVSPLFKTIVLSVIAVSVDSTVVCVPVTTKFPSMVTVCVSIDTLPVVPSAVLILKSPLVILFVAIVYYTLYSIFSRLKFY